MTNKYHSKHVQGLLSCVKSGRCLLIGVDWRVSEGFDSDGEGLLYASMISWFIYVGTPKPRYLQHRRTHTHVLWHCEKVET